MRLVSLDNITTEMELAQDIYNNDGRLLITAGSVLRPKTIDKLKMHQIYAVYIEDVISRGIKIESAISDRTIMRALDAVEKFDLDAIFDSANDIIESLSSSRAMYDDTECIRQYDEYTYMHSVNVAVDMVTLGIGMGLNPDKLMLLAVGGLLHDIGKTKIPIEIINKKGKLTEEEMNIVKQHPNLGVEMISGDITVPAVIKGIIREHHENYDGSGYPRGIKSGKIMELSEICHTCDIFDALLSKRSYKEKFSYCETIKILQSYRGNILNPEIVDNLFKYVPVYRKGIIIKVADIKTNEVQDAIVVGNNRKAMLKPIIRIVGYQENINLLESYKYTIVS